MFQGKCGSAFQLLSGEQGTLSEEDVLPTGETLLEALRNKHPIAQGLKEEALYSFENTPPRADPVIFECIDTDLIRHSAKQTKCSAAHQV